MIEVRIRDEYESAGRKLCTWPATDLDGLMATLTAWNVYTKHDLQETFSGQFRHDDTGTYFEVVIADQGDRGD